jgi:ATP-dependent helicase HrpA
MDYPKNLPIVPKRGEIIRAIRQNQVLIVSGETGCGKSTQLPKMCIEAGRGISGRIGCTQPRRIAATTIARRIGEELGEDLGQSVGYKIRFNDRTNRNAYIKVMTDGMLLAETQGDPRLLEYDTLIIDEAHERSLNIDFILGILRTLLSQRPELKVIITSATLDTEKFSQAFRDAPVLHVSGRLYSVEVEYTPLDPELENEGELTYVDMAVKSVDNLRANRRFGDILIFMPTEQDILETCERLKGRQYSSTNVLPLFARLPASHQGRVYSVQGPKIVVATNVAETSLTIPGIKYVIDTGLARISQYLPRTRTKSLPISPISKSSADQRKGRAGRVQKGVCIRLYTEEDYLSRPAHTLPEILRSNLAEVILRMLFLNLGHPDVFPFLDKPAERSIKDGFDLLLELGAIEKQDAGHVLTEKGRIMAQMPLDPKISRMMIEASKEGCAEEVAVIASALSIQDPRERPAERAALSDQTLAPFKDADSDFLTMLNIWKRYHREWETLKTQNRMRKFCREHFLSFPRMREWVYTHGQITSIMARYPQAQIPKEPDSRYATIHRSILSGFLSNIAAKKEKNVYTAARGREVMVFPGSTLFNKNAAWIVAAEMVKTSRLFARTVAKIDPEWLEILGGSLCRSTYLDPHWDRTRGEVLAYQQVKLYGLVIVPRRPVSYGAIDPEESHKIFIQSGLVEENLQEALPFLVHNQALKKKVASMENKLRRRDILASDQVIADFYSPRLKGVYDIRTLKKMIKERGSDDFLKMREPDLVLSSPDPERLALFPDQVAIGKARFKTSYKFAPGKEDDGVTVQIPLKLAPGVPSEKLQWGVRGLLKEKITALLKGLPKRYRKQLVPASRTAEVIIEEMEENEESLFTSLSRFIYRRFGVDVPASAWSDTEIPDHLRMRMSIVDHTGKEVDSGRDFRLLRTADPKRPSERDSTSWKMAEEQWEKADIKSWDFGPLPESIYLDDQMMAYAGLSADAQGIRIRLFESEEPALESHRKGVQALLLLHLSRDLKFLRRNLAFSGKESESAKYLGNTRAIEEALYEALMEDLFRVNVRTPEQFAEQAERIGRTVFEKAKELKNQAIKVLDSYCQTRQAIHAIEKAHRSNHTLVKICALVRTDLDALVPHHFVKLYPMERLVHLPRYIKALQIRAERAANHPEKDQHKMAQVEPFVQAIEVMVKGLSPHSSREKRDALEEFRWMVEEFKISLFAQEMKTLFPVSAKRLEEKMKDFERMA